MRIIAGTHRGRILHPPKGLPVRPTTDLAKESLFNILNNRIDYTETRVLDLFAGTGSISFEFASRGACTVISVDMEGKSTSFINRAAQDFGFGNLRAVRAECIGFIGFCREKFDVIFADPPYEFPKVAEIPGLIFEKQLLNENGLLILEHSSKYNFSSHPQFTEMRNYSKVHFSFFHLN